AGEIRSAWAGATSERDIFFGEIHDVRLDGLPMPRNGVPADTAGIRRRLASGRFSLEADVSAGRPVVYPSWISKLKAGGANQLTLFQIRRHAGVAIPVRGRELELHPITVTLPDAFPESAGGIVQLAASASNGVVRLRATSGGATRAIEFGLSPAYGWRLVSPFELGIEDGVRWFTGVVLSLSVLPLAYWAAHAAGWPRCVPPLAIAAGL